MLISAASLLLLACVVGLGAQDVSVDVEIDINIEDPCAKHKCPAGEKCESVITRQLLGLPPVAHCTPDQAIKQDSSPCVDYQIHANILNCKTQREWNDIGANQCLLRIGTTPILTKTKAKYTCPRQSKAEMEYMFFTFTCCSVEPTDPSKPPPPTPVPPKDPGNSYNSQDSGIQNASPSWPSNEKPSNEQPNVMYLIPIILALMLLLAFVALILVVWQKRRSVHRHPPKPKMEFATSFVNPAADHMQSTEQDWTVNPLDTTDKSLLIVNEHPRK